MANITTQTIRVDLSTGKVIPTAYTHQNDTARTLVFDMYNGGLPYDMTGNTVNFAYKSPVVDGQYSVIAGSSMASGTVSGNKVTVALPVAYTRISGVGLLTMIITPSSGTIRPVNIRLVVLKSADGDDTVMGASDFPEGLYDYMDNWLEENEPTEIANLKNDVASRLEYVYTIQGHVNLKKTSSTEFTISNKAGDQYKWIGVIPRQPPNYVNFDTIGSFTFTIPTSDTWYLVFNTDDNAFKVIRRFEISEKDGVLSIIRNGKIVPLHTRYTGDLENLLYTYDFRKIIPVSGAISYSYNVSEGYTVNIDGLKVVSPTKPDAVSTAYTATLNYATTYLTVLLYDSITNSCLLTNGYQQLSLRQEYALIEAFYNGKKLGISPEWLVKKENEIYRATVVSGIIWAFITNNKLTVRCSDTARIALNNEAINCSGWSLDATLANQYVTYITADHSGFHKKTFGELSESDCLIAFCYNKTVYPLQPFIECNSIPILQLYQRTNIPIFVNNKKLYKNHKIISMTNNTNYFTDFCYFLRFVNAYENDGSYMWYKDNEGRVLPSIVRVLQNSVDITGKKILTIGDSITNRGWFQDQILSRVNVEFVGTRETQFTSLVAEGYSGCKASEVLASPTITPYGQTTVANPFWDGNACTMQHYCESTGIEPDIVVIEFGLNETNSAEYYSAVQSFINTIVSYNSNIQVYVVQMFGEAELPAENHSSANRQMEGMRCITESYSFTNCTLIPCFFIMVDEYDYISGKMQYGYDNVTVDALTDGVHPSESVGFAKLGDMIYNFLGI